MRHAKKIEVHLPIPWQSLSMDKPGDTCIDNQRVCSHLCSQHVLLELKDKFVLCGYTHQSDFSIMTKFPKACSWEWNSHEM